MVLKVNTSPSGKAASSPLQLQRWTGSHWEPFGEVLGADSE